MLEAEFDFDRRAADALKKAGAPVAAQREGAALDAREAALSTQIDALPWAPRQAESSGLFALAFSVVGLLFWPLAYVLGGSFWRPPRV